MYVFLKCSRPYFCVVAGGGGGGSGGSLCARARMCGVCVYECVCMYVCPRVYMCIT